MSILLPPNYNWIKTKIIEVPKDLEISSNIIGNRLVFKWDLLKSGESFTFDSLIEYTTKDEEIKVKTKSNTDTVNVIKNNLKFEHRITNLNKIEKEVISPLRTSIGEVVFSFFIFLLFTALAVFSFQSDFRTGFSIKKADKEYVVDITIKDKIYFELKDKGKLIDKIKADEIASIYNLRPVIIKQKPSYVSGIMLLVFGLIFLGDVVNGISTYRREKKLLKFITN